MNNKYFTVENIINGDVKITAHNGEIQIFVDTVSDENFNIYFKCWSVDLTNEGKTLETIYCTNRSEVFENVKILSDNANTYDKFQRELLAMSE